MSITETETEETRMYNEGWNDGYEGNARSSEHPSYLEGFYDGLEESDDLDGSYYGSWDDED